MATTKEERSRMVAQMRANFAQEGFVPDIEDEALLEQYIEGSATLTALYEHACEYAFAAHEREQQRQTKEELPVVPLEGTTMTTTKEERSLRIAQMRTNFAREGGIPNAEKEALLDRFIEGNATWAQLYDHALEYVTTAREREQLRLAKEKSVPDFQSLREAYEAEAKIYEAEQSQKNIERRRMSKEQRERHEAIDAARANVELSGFNISEENWRDCMRYANCEITIDEYLSLRAKPENS